ncbi:MAG: AraC family transcriptional regulator [Candidatus Thiodiazotropha sp.]|nr:AraC family transcriptional regulator [Candidatus Thiodiazotropha sp.]MCM8885109.1 AraC family transcriptional regulator [Candidatus Thiodiazotropha sp.]MCM8921412.1 AraC family transcriptional regulator [Candidatus Thiodiazotropha sp.]
MRNELTTGRPHRRLEKFTLHATRDIDQAREMTSRVYCPHRLDVLNHRQFDACHNHASIGSCSLNYLDFRADVKIEPGYIPGFYLFEIPMNGKAKIVTGKQEVLIGQGTGAVINPEHYTVMHWDTDCQMLMLKVDEHALIQQLARLLRRPINGSLSFDPALDAKQGAQGSWFRYLDYCLDEIERTPPQQLNSPLFAEFRSTLLTSLLLTLPNNFSDALQASDKRVAPCNVRRAMDYIHANFRDTVTIEQLVEVSNVSARSLFDCFRKFVGSTPMQYLRKIRLEKARERLQVGNPDDNVTQVAMACGFTQLGRFSAWYKQVYGETPCQTFRSARSSGLMSQ